MLAHRPQVATNRRYSTLRLYCSLIVTDMLAERNATVLLRYQPTRITQICIAPKTDTRRCCIRKFQKLKNADNEIRLSVEVPQSSHSFGRVCHEYIPPVLKQRLDFDVELGP